MFTQNHYKLLGKKNIGLLCFFVFYVHKCLLFKFQCLKMRKTISDRFFQRGLDFLKLKYGKVTIIMHCISAAISVDTLL